MQIRAELRLEGKEGEYSLCFRHAVLRALKGEDIEPHIGEYDFLDCSDCSEEAN